jgi:hypothetical protein
MSEPTRLLWVVGGPPSIEECDACIHGQRRQNIEYHGNDHLYIICPRGDVVLSFPDSHAPKGSKPTCNKYKSLNLEAKTNEG